MYLGRDEALDRDVAIKTLRVEGSPDDESRGRFEIEAKAAARLQHSNIVTVFELGEDRGLPFIAMELLGGEDLETMLRSGEDLSTTERLDIVIQTLRGLDFAHAHHIVHRDIKPSNIRVLDDGGVKILDFGIAKVESTSVTRAGMMVGTPYYMSPEHIRGGVLDGRSDVFAVGVILHELFAGARPFTAEDPSRVMFRIVSEPHPRLPKAAAGRLTEDVQRVIDKALEKDQDTRFGSAAAMADELAEVRARYPAPHLRADDAAAITQARKNFAVHKTSPSTIQTVEAIAKANPEATEARRLLRALKRKPMDAQSAAETAAFPELDATFAQAEQQGEATLLSGKTISGSAETVAQGGASTRSLLPPPPPRSNALVYGAVAATVALAGLAAVIYLNQTGAPDVAPISAEPKSEAPTIEAKAAEARTDVAEAPARRKSPATAVVASKAMPVAPKSTVEIRSQPPGASVRLDRKPVGATPLRIEVASDAAHTVTLSLDGHQPRELRLEPPIQGALEATLVPNGPPATLVVESAYPVTVTASGRVIGADKTGATATLPAGAQEVLIESAALFLKHRETVRLEPGGTITIKTPSTGKLGVRATPDNCRILVNGVFVDYPPILDRAIVAGSHLVTFEWPDGTRAEERVQIQAGKPSYVMGRKP